MKSRLMSGSPRTFGRFVLRGLWLPLSFGVTAAVITVRRITSTPPSYVSLAKLEATSLAAGSGTAAKHLEQQTEFHDSIVEILQSRELGELAHKRVQTLFLELPDPEMKVRVMHDKNLSIINVAAIGGGGRENAQVFLNALLDELKDLRETNPEPRRDKAGNVPDGNVRVLERASKALEDVVPWELITFVRAVEGLATGMFLLLFCAAFRPSPDLRGNPTLPLR